MSLTDKALAFCQAAHGDQKRKYTGEPYWTHPAAVAASVAEYTAEEEVIAAALLHDVLEDTAVTFDQLETEFGARVAALVREVTDVSKPEDGNRAIRKAIDCKHLANSSPEGALIKLADLLDNTSSVVASAPEFAKKYLVEKAAVLDVLKHADQRLWQRTRQSIEKAQKQLSESQ